MTEINKNITNHLLVPVTSMNSGAQMRYYDNGSDPPGESLTNCSAPPHAKADPWGMGETDE